jgi:uncharacterized protein (TIGR03435 family)
LREISNHLWQSSLFAIPVAVLAFALRSHQARIRYGLWLVASAKFLMPLSLLIVLGGHLPCPARATATLTTARVAVNTLEPFVGDTSFEYKSLILTHPQRRALSLESILLLLWFCGFLLTAAYWWLQLHRIWCLSRSAKPMLEGREVAALRRLELALGLEDRPTDLLTTDGSMEPGVFGILRPALLWPRAISAHIDDEHLNAILAHELFHVRRRDNFTSSIHMITATVFWFHPLVWWIGDRLVTERERACDEAVVELGSQRRIYAESILKVLGFCLSSPLACVSGVAGADLNKRMAQIMTGRVARKLDSGRKLLLAAVAMTTIAVPVIVGLTQASPRGLASQAQDSTLAAPAFDTISIKPNDGKGPFERFPGVGTWSGVHLGPNQLNAANVKVGLLIDWAYGLDPRDNQVSGAPSWVDSERYDIVARLDTATTNQLQNLPLPASLVPIFPSRFPGPLPPSPPPTPSETLLKARLDALRPRLLGALLADGFKLRAHREINVLSAYELVIADDGLKLQESIPLASYPQGRVIQVDSGRIVGTEVPISTLARLLSEELGHPVLDKTGLTEHYDIALQWPETEGVQAARDPAPSISEALEEQLGLKLAPAKISAKIVVVDHIEKPQEQ